MQYKYQEGDSENVLATPGVPVAIQSKLLIPKSDSREILAPGLRNSSAVLARS